jgi:hypothetical protein
MFCKICGSELDEGSFFCPACGAQIKSHQDDASEINKMKQAVKREVTQPTMSPSPSKPVPVFMHRHSQAVNSSPMVFGLIILTIAMAIMLPNETQYILPSGFMLIGLSVLFLHYRHSPHRYENRLLYMAIACLVLTFGFAIMFSYESNYIIPAGCMLAAIILTGHFARRSPHNRVFHGIIIVSILTIGSAMMFPYETDYIFPAGGIIIALIIIAWALRRSSQRALYENSHSLRP